MKLRVYQKRTVDRVLDFHARGRRSVLIQAPCGSGKTEIAAEIISSVNQRWLFVVHTNVLASQTERRLRMLGLEVERYGISDEFPTARVVVASIQALLIRDTKKQLVPDCICYDEAHHYEADTWSDLAARYPDAFRVGLTATPQRRDGRTLLRHFDEVVVAATYKELIQQKLLVDAHVWAPTISQPPGLAMDPIEAWNEFSEGVKTIVAFGRVDEARMWAERFNTVLGKIGKRAACVDGETSWSYNQDTLREFAEGKIDLLTNVYYITEGFDLPDVGCIILARRFQFRGTYMQFAGRALRVAPGKDHATVIDLTGCTYLHGVPHSDRPWSLDDNEIPSAGQKNPDAVGTGKKREALKTTREGVICVCPVVYGDKGNKPVVPKRAPLIPGLRVVYRGVSVLMKIEGKARKLAGKTCAAIAKRWAARERRRQVRITESEA